ncbi:MAG: restriction endonuclease subunit S [Nanoarchaeota archaeon]|nr:restriction endonuclease subunit S [Nanoarchaeota archaeon]MCG2815190.1 restriction endonuclease subunit S [Candidatus Aminicenantes bacterium]
MGSEWQEVAFGDVLINGTRNGIYKKKEFHGYGIKIVNMGELFANSRLFSIPMKRVELTSKERERFCLQSGDLLFARRSLVAEGAGKCSIVMETDEATTFESSIIRARPNAEKLESLFGYYLFNSPHGKYLLGSILRQVAVSGITGSDLVQLKISLPPLHKQRAIAHILGTLDDKIELNRRMNETLEAMARAIFKSWFVDFDPVRAKAEGRDPALPAEIAALFPESFENSELGEIPKGWEVKTIGEVVEFAYGKALKASNRKPGCVPVFGSNGPVGFHNEALVKGPGIVIGRKGNPGIVTWSYKDCFPIDTTFYVKQTVIILSLNYLFYALKAQDLPSLSADSAVPGLNRNLAYMSNILVPSKEVLTAFDEQIDPLFHKINANDNESESLASLRDILLPKLISGELRVPDAERFVEENGV